MASRYSFQKHSVESHTFVCKMTLHSSYSCCFYRHCTGCANTTVTFQFILLSPNDFFYFLTNEFRSSIDIMNSLTIGEKYNGGLGLTHVESFVKSQKISWIKRILDNEKHITVQLLKQFPPEMDLNEFLNCD